VISVKLKDQECFIKIRNLLPNQRQVISLSMGIGATSVSCMNDVIVVKAS
jgi:hypothetical protein